MNRRALEHCFQMEASAARGSQPRVVFNGRIRGASQRISVRLPDALRIKLLKYAPTCHTIAVVALAQRGLLKLIDEKERLVSHWLPDGSGGEFFHAVMPWKRGQTHVECGALPSRSKSAGRTHAPMISVPDALLEALATESRYLSNALTALADWEIDRLIEQRQRITVTPQ